MYVSIYTHIVIVINHLITCSAVANSLAVRLASTVIHILVAFPTKIIFLTRSIHVDVRPFSPLTTNKLLIYDVSQSLTHWVYLLLKKF